MNFQKSIVLYIFKSIYIILFGVRVQNHKSIKGKTTFLTSFRLKNVTCNILCKLYFADLHYIFYVYLRLFCGSYVEHCNLPKIKNKDKNVDL